MSSLPAICLRCQQRLLVSGKATSRLSAPIRRPLTTSSPTARLFRPQAYTPGTRSRPISRPSNTAAQISSRTTPKRTFTSTPHRATTTTTLLNPRHNDDSTEQTITITPRASARLSEIMSTDSNPSLALRITVESGGCHGFQYLMSLTSMDDISKEEDTVFEGDKGAKVVMDEPSLELLQGSRVDYTMELIGSQFKVVGNPRASSSCGCGTSFDIQ